MFDYSNIDELVSRRGNYIRKPAGTRPAVWILEEAGRRAVVKEFTSNGPVYRNLIGRFLIWRESKAYRKLKGLDGVPELYGVVGGTAIIIEEIQGRYLENIEKELTLPSSFFLELEKLIEEIHLRGVAHCDLKRAPNILLGSNCRPYIVDWASAISRDEFRLFPLDMIYRRFLIDDRLAVIKLKLRHLPDEVTDEQRKRLEYRSTPEKVIRSIRDFLRSLLQSVS